MTVPASPSPIRETSNYQTARKTHRRHLLRLANFKGAPLPTLGKQVGALDTRQWPGHQPTAASWAGKVFVGISRQEPSVAFSSGTDARVAGVWKSKNWKTEAKPERSAASLTPDEHPRGGLAQRIADVRR